VRRPEPSYIVPDRIGNKPDDIYPERSPILPARHEALPTFCITNETAQHLEKTGSHVCIGKVVKRLTLLLLAAVCKETTAGFDPSRRMVKSRSTGWR
jgi:hypothetical protein